MRFVTHNVGNATPNKIMGLLTQCQVGALQEMGDRFDIYRAARAAGWEFVPVVGAERSTPVAYNPAEVRLVKVLSFQLTPATRTRSGGVRDLAGPDVVKAKYFVGALFEYAGRRFVFGSVHYPASQWAEDRERLALKASRRIRRRFLGRRVPVFVAGDFNTPPTGRGVAPLRAGRRWRLLGGSRPTHKNRTIDYAWARGRRLRLTHEVIRRTGSDHRAVVMEVAW